MLDYNMAKSVWALQDEDNSLPIYGDEMTDPSLWLFNLSETLSSNKIVVVLVMLWAIWYTRRRVILEHEYESPLSTHLFISRYIDEITYQATNGRAKMYPSS